MFKKPTKKPTIGLDPFRNNYLPIDFTQQKLIQHIDLWVLSKIAIVLLSCNQHCFLLTPKCTADVEYILKIHNGYIAISTDKSLVNKQKSKKTFQIIFRSVRLPLYAHKYQLAVSSSPVACVKYY